MNATLQQSTPQNLNINPHLWVAQYADYLYSWAMCRVNDDNIAKDLVQETFLAALEKSDIFEGRCTEKTWLTAILKYKIMEHYRNKVNIISKMRSINSRLFFQDDGHFNAADRPQACGIEQENKLDKKEFQQILSSCMKKLPSLWHTVFTMKFMKDEKTPLICDELKLSAANYWVIMHRTKLNLRDCIQKNIS